MHCSAASSARGPAFLNASEFRPGARLSGLADAPEAGKAAPREHYPAPYALIDLWEKHGGDKAAMLAAEKTSFANLMVTPTAQNLIRVFFLREQMKKLAAAATNQARSRHRRRRDGRRHRGLVRRAGPAGDACRHEAGADRGRHQARRRSVRQDHAQAHRGARRAGPADPDMEGEGVRNADLIIEAVPEKLELKQKVYAGLEPKMKPGAILATNTSSIPLQDCAPRCNRPERLVGLHFFNPVSRLQLVEVVSHDGTDPQMLKQALAFVGAIDRLPLPVKSSPGFVVNRALTPYMLEAMVMLDEKIDKLTIDAAAESSACRWVRSNSPTRSASISVSMSATCCARNSAIFCRRRRPGCATRSRKGELGRKTGKGFYVWKDGKAEKAELPGRRPREPTPEMIDRLILPMSNVCVACLREGIVDNADVVDGAMIFGTGYAPFRGGPLNYARRRGRGKRGRDLARAGAEIRRPVYAGCRLGEFQVTRNDSSEHAPADETEPRGDLCIRTLAMPADTNANGDIFRRLAAQPDGYRRRRVRVQDRKVAHRDRRDRGDEFPQGRLCRRSRFGPRQSGAGRPHLDHRASRSLGRAPQGECKPILVTDGNFTYVSIDDQKAVRSQATAFSPRPAASTVSKASSSATPAKPSAPRASWLTVM
jgi:3-hydroxyacyl-CoA dehydrogenase